MYCGEVPHPHKGQELIVAQTGKKKRSSRVMAVIWSVAAFSAIGSLPMMVLRNPGLAVRVSMVAAACAIIPYGIRSRSLLQGALRGAGLGFIAGSSLVSVLDGMRLIPPQVFPRMGATYLTGTIAMCVAVSMLFAHLAQRRRRMMEQPWE
jgi:hypothetical protein